MIQMRDAISKGKKIIDGEIGVMKMRKLGKKVEEKPEIKKIRVQNKQQKSDIQIENVTPIIATDRHLQDVHPEHPEYETADPT